MMRWTAAEFDAWLKEISDPRKKQRALDELTKDQAKEYREWQTFNCFARGSRLDVDPRTIQNRKAPEPDIHCEVSGQGRYYELGEVTDERIARNAAEAERAGDDIHSGCFSQGEPLEKMIFQKCEKTYSLNGLPAELLLHFGVGHQVPYTHALTALLADSRERIVGALNRSQFRAIRFFDCWTDSVLAVVERDAGGGAA